MKVKVQGGKFRAVMIAAAMLVSYAYDPASAFFTQDFKSLIMKMDRSSWVLLPRKAQN